MKQTNIHSMMLGLILGFTFGGMLTGTAMHERIKRIEKSVQRIEQLLDIKPEATPADRSES